MLLAQQWQAAARLLLTAADVCRVSLRWLQGGDVHAKQAGTA